MDMMKTTLPSEDKPPKKNENEKLMSLSPFS